MEADCIAISISLSSELDGRSQTTAGVRVPLSSSPGKWLELIFQRRIGDSSSIVGDRRGSDYGDDLQDLFLGEAGGEECIELLFAQVPPLLDERLRQGRKCAKSPVPRHKLRADRVVSSELTPCLRASAVWNATAYALEFATASVRRTI